MNKENKRYVVQMDMYVYADNDYMAKKRANDLRLSIDNRRYYRKLDDPTFIPKDKSNKPLPF